MDSTIARPRRRLGLSLRILMLVVFVLACVLGWMANHIRVQRRAVAAIKEAGGSVIYDWEWDETAKMSGIRRPRKRNAKPPGPSWLRKLIGPEMFEAVWAVSFLRIRIDDQLHVDDAVIEQVGHLPRVRRLHIDSESNVSGAMFAKIKDLKNLEYLLCGAAPTDAELAPVAAMTKLEFLTFDHANLTNAGMEHLRGLAKLKTLQLGVANPEEYGKIDSGGLVPLQGLTKLEMLNIRNARITSLAPLRSLTSLRMLWLSGNPIDDAGLEGLAHHPSLVNVRLTDSPSVNMTDRTMKVLGTIPHLKHISASGNGITDQGLRDIGGLTDLITLQLTDTRVKEFSPLKRMTKLKTLWITRERIDDGSLAFLDRMPSLNVLRVEGVRPNDEDLARIGRMTGLSELTLDNAGITDEKLKHFSGMTGLLGLTLGRNPITDAGLVHLSGLTRMRVLGLSQTQVAGPGLIALSRMPLYRLHLSGCPLDAAGIEALRKFPGLTSLNLSDTKITDAAIPTLSRLVRCGQFILQNTNISAKGMAALQKALPRARIITDIPRGPTAGRDGG